MSYNSVFQSQAKRFWFSQPSSWIKEDNPSSGGRGTGEHFWTFHMQKETKPGCSLPRTVLPKADVGAGYWKRRHPQIWGTQ
jgi:hypothetical protein